MAIRLPCLDRTRQADRPEKQKLFRDRRFTGVRVGNDRKGATPGHFSRLLGHEKLPETRIWMGWEKLRVVVTVGGGAAAQKAQRFLTRILNAVRGPGGNHHRITGDYGETLFPQDHEPLPGENMVELLRFPVAMKGRNLPRGYPGLGQALPHRGACLGMSKLSNLRLV